MTLRDELAEWAKTRPGWQRELLRRSAQGTPLTSEELPAFVKRIIDAGSFSTSLDAVDIPGGDASQARVRLLGLRKQRNVNSLVENQPLEFSPEGLTVIYGDNASGKSGYARLLKAAVRARHRDEILANIFVDSGPGHMEAEVVAEVGSSQRVIDWPGPVDKDLTRMHFYDAACGELYVATETAVTYKPEALYVLDDLIEKCDKVRLQIDRLLSESDAVSTELPSLPVGTGPQQFLASISHETTEEDIDLACALPTPSPDLAEIKKNEARLRASDPAQERRDLERESEALDAIATQLETMTAAVDDEAVRSLDKQRKVARELRSAVDLAASQSFDADPLPVGSQAWRALWEAARRYSENDAFPGQPFPVTAAGARCLVCQQRLTADGSDRMTRFDDFVRGQIEVDAKRAEDLLKAALDSIRILDAVPAPVERSLALLETRSAEFAGEMRDALSSLSTRKSELLGRGESDNPTLGSELPSLDPSDVRKAAREKKAAAAQVDQRDLQAQIDEISLRRQTLEATIALADAREDVLSEVRRLRKRTRLEAAKRETDTGPITRKSTELTRDHVTDVLRDRFTRESDRLRLERVTLEDTGGQKGQLRQRPAFVGAVRSAPMSKVLSEGEQTALGLAGFFTEVYADDSGSGIILDDPVSSLDHVRRGRVAKRLRSRKSSRALICELMREQRRIAIAAQ